MLPVSGGVGLGRRSLFLQQSTRIQIALNPLWRETMKHLMVAIIALLVPAAAMAQECKADREKLCKDVVDTTEVVACLKQHEAELSEACKTKVEASGAKENK